MYISLFLGVPMGVPIYNLWGARGVCSPQTTWSSSCSQNIWGVALWTRFLASYRLLCRQKMTWFWHCHKHILVITQFDNHRHSYVIVYRELYMYNIYIYVCIYIYIDEVGVVFWQTIILRLVLCRTLKMRSTSTWSWTALFCDECSSWTTKKIRVCCMLPLPNDRSSAVVAISQSMFEGPSLLKGRRVVNKVSELAMNSWNHRVVDSYYMLNLFIFGV